MNRQKKLYKNKTFIGLRKYTHAQRAKLLQDLIVPMLRKELGTNLIAIAADGSYARYTDTDFSDLELMVFVRDKANLPRGFSKLYRGLLIEGLFITEEEYHKTIDEPNEAWYIAGSDRLLPIKNPKFIHRLQQYHVKNLAGKCEAIALPLLNEIQETFGKLFNAISSRNHENLFLILADAVMVSLRLLSYINHKPYTSLNSMISEARKLKKKPKGFDEFLELVIDGRYYDLVTLGKCSRNLFSGIEDYFKQRYGRLMYDGDLSKINRQPRKT